MPLLRVAAASLKADCLLAFAWVGPNTAVVRAATFAAAEQSILSLPQAELRRAGGALLHRLDPERLVSTSLAARLPFTPGASLALQANSADAAGGLLALWEHASRVPARVLTEPQRACSELARMTEDWLRQQLGNDRAELFAHVMRCTADGVIFVPDNGQLAFVNEAAASLLGVPSGSVSGEKVALRMRDLRQRVVNGAEREAMAVTLFARQMDVKDSLWELDEDGAPDARRYLRVSCLRANHGSLKGRLWMFRDVSAEQQALHRLSERTSLYRSQHQFLHAVLEAIDDAVVAVDANNTLTLLNSSARERHEVRDLPVGSLTMDALRFVVYENADSHELGVEEHPLHRALGGAEVTNSSVHATRGGARRDLLVSARALRSATGEVVGAVSVERDVTERNALEAQMRQNEKLQALGRMAASVTHDVNNMLTVMQSSLAVLAVTDRTSPAYGEDMETLAAALEQSRALTRGLLDFCRGRARLPSEVDLAVLLGRLHGLMRHLVPSTVSLRVEVRGDDPLLVLGDAAELEQVLFNLITNAADATPANGEIAVTVGAERHAEPLVHMLGVVPPGEYVVLAVADTGAGMSQQVIAHMFEPFFTTKRAGLGTGLGLSTVYGIVDRYQGRVVVESAEKQGSTFRVFLPRCSGEAGTDAMHDGEGEPPVVPAPDRARVPTALQSTSSSPAQQAGKARVLLVDDDASVNRAISRMVQHAGFEVISAGSGAEALQRTAAGGIDIILSDVQMPGMTGGELVRAIRATGDTTPVVLMSGYSELTDVELVSMQKVVAFLTKPFTPDEVSYALTSTLQGSAGQQC